MNLGEEIKREIKGQGEREKGDTDGEREKVEKNENERKLCELRR